MLLLRTTYFFFEIGLGAFPSINIAMLALADTYTVYIYFFNSVNTRGARNILDT